MRRALLALFVATAPGVARAYRPFVSTDAAVAERGEIELEFGYMGFVRDGRRTAIVAPSAVLNLGVIRDLELVGEFKLVSDVSHGADKGHTRFEDSALSVKWVAHEGVLQEHGAGPSLAVELGLLLPTLRGQDQPGGELIGIASGRALGFTVHVNAGTLVEPGSDAPGPIWGVIVEHPVVGHLRAVAEVNGESPSNSGAENSALVGAIWEVGAPPPLHGLALDIGLRHGIS